MHENCAGTSSCVILSRKYEDTCYVFHDIYYQLYPYSFHPVEVRFHANRLHGYIWYTDYTTILLVPNCHSFYLGMLNDEFMAIKGKTGMAPFNALDKIMDQMSPTTDFNRQLKHCVGSTGNLFPCHTCEDYLNFIEVVIPSALCVNGIHVKKNLAG